MSFLLNLVSCCGVAGHNVPPNTPTAEEAEETSSLVQVSGNGKKSHQAGKLAGKGTVPPLPWRPSLCTITEDDVVKEGVDYKVMRNVVSKPYSWAFGYRNHDLWLQDTFESLPSASPAFLY